MTRPKWLTRNVKILSAVSLAQDAASELLYPLLPILLTSVLGAPVFVVGLIEGIAEGSAALMKYVGGRWSDRIGRKPLVASGYALAAVGKVLVAASLFWPLVLAGRVVDRLGKGTRSAPRDALLAEGVADTELGRVFGFHRATDTIGAVIGPLIGLAVLAGTGGNVRVALWVAVVPAILSAVLVFLVREPNVPARRAEANTQTAPTNTSVAFSSEFKRVVGILALIACVNFPDALVLLRVSQLGFSVAAVVGAYALYNLVYALASYPAGAFADRHPKAHVYALGLGCFCIGYIGLGLVHGGPAVVALLCVYGGFNALTDGVGKAWISALVPASERGRAQGIFQGLSGASVLFAGIWAGLTWNIGAGDGTFPLILAGGVAGIAALLMWWVNIPESRGAAVTLNP